MDQFGPIVLVWFSLFSFVVRIATVAVQVPGLALLMAYKVCCQVVELCCLFRPELLAVFVNLEKISWSNTYLCTASTLHLISPCQRHLESLWCSESCWSQLDQEWYKPRNIIPRYVWTLLRLADIFPDSSSKILLYSSLSHLIMLSIYLGFLWLSLQRSTCWTYYYFEI